MSVSSSARLRSLLAYLAVAAVGLALALAGGGERLDQAALDHEFILLREIAPTPVPPGSDVVIIGLDEQAFVTLPEPSSLWHPYLGKLFTALAAAKPAVVGLDLALPVRSYNFLKPGYDQPLADGLRQLAKAAPLVTGRYVTGRRRLRPILPELIAAAGGTPPASLTLCREHDGVVRRIKLQLCAEMEERATLTSAMGQALALKSSGQGLIDYSVGGELSYLPLLQVLKWIDGGDSERLRQAVGGRVVLIGSLFPTDERYPAPLPLAAWEPGNRLLHSVVLRAQVLRTMLVKDLVQPLAALPTAALLLLAATSWFGAAGRRKTLLFLPALLCLPPLSLLALWHGTQLPLASLMLTSLLGFAARLAYDSARYYRQRSELRSAFAGYVSPAVMKAIQRGRLRPKLTGQRCQVAVLYAGVHGLSEHCSGAAAEAPIALLNRYFAAMAAAVHGHGGIVDKFVGEGLMASFGTPQPLPLPARNALEAAHDMLRRLARLDSQLRQEGQATLAVGVAVHAGEVLAGFVGSKQRHDYVLIGDPVDAVAELEALTTAAGYPVLCTAAVAEAVGRPAFLVDLGPQALPGRSPLQLFGWDPVDQPPAGT